MSMSWVERPRAASGLENSFGELMLRFEVRCCTGIVNKYQCTLAGSQQAFAVLAIIARIVGLGKDVLLPVHECTK